MLQTKPPEGVVLRRRGTTSDGRRRDGRRWRRAGRGGRGLATELDEAEAAGLKVSHYAIVCPAMDLAGNSPPAAQPTNAPAA